jgi:hypothetical protein
MLLFPQIPHPVALALAEECKGVAVSELAQRASVLHADAQYTPTGGSRVTTAQLSELRVKLLQAATDAGYPKTPNLQRAAVFDVDASIVLFQNVTIAPAEAALAGVWEYLCCALLPDLVRWRFGAADEAKDTSLERYVAGRRNTFQRLWWRVYHLSQPPHNDETSLRRLLSALGEDELVQLMERPSLAGIQGLAREIGIGLLAASARHANLTRRELIREAQKRFLRLLSFLSLEFLPADEIHFLVRAVFEQVARSLSATRTTPPR